MQSKEFSHPFNIIWMIVINILGIEVAIVTEITKSVLGLGLKAIGKTGIARAMQPLLGGMGAVLMFHHVGYRAPSYFGGNDHLSIRPEFLAQLLDEFRQECIDIVSLEEAVWRMSSGRSTQPFVTFTFDDGYRDNIETAYPILQSFRVPFTLFVCSGFVDRKVPIWWLSLEQIIQQNNVIELAIGGKRHVFQCIGKNEKRRSFEKAVKLLNGIADEQLHETMQMLCDDVGHDAMALVDREMSTWDMLKELNKDPLVTIGTHTHGHPFLPSLSRESAKREMIDGRNRIKKMLGTEPEFFAYPYGFKGAADEREVALAEEVGFKAAFTTRKGLLSAQHIDHAWSLPRVSINGHYQNMAAMRALLSGLPFYVANGFNRVKTL